MHCFCIMIRIILCITLEFALHQMTRVVAGKTCSRSLVSSFPLSRPVADSPGGRSTRRRTSLRWKRTTTTTQTIRESRKFLVFNHNYHWTLLFAGILPTWITRQRTRYGTNGRLSITTTTQAALSSRFLLTSGTPGRLWWQQLMCLWMYIFFSKCLPCLWLTPKSRAGPEKWK